MVARLNHGAEPTASIQFEKRIPFGPALTIDAFRLGNGLRVLICEDHSAPVVAYHTWYRVGSRHEKEGKTGLAHLFEHLMFNETKNLKAGEFDRKLEQAGAESNAATWLDWTQYNIAVPKDQLKLVIQLEADRMAHLVLQEPQVASEREVVANERRYRVDDDVEGAVSELLWASAFKEHAYRWPTIGWMKDIQGFTTEDCLDFYRTYYAPNNATVIVAGDVSPKRTLELIAKAYGHLQPTVLRIEDTRPEPPQTAERRSEVQQPTTTEKLAIGYHSPALGDFDYPATSLLVEILFGGRASRVVQRLVREMELAIDVQAFLGPFRDPGLLEVFASARGGHTAEELLAVIDEEIAKVQGEPISLAELERARARSELALLSGLDTAEGKASTIGFYDTVLDRPAAAFERLEAAAAVTGSDILRVARRYLRPQSRSVILVRPQTATEAA